MRAEMPFEIAYVMNGFPRLSETFITNEIHLLETLGMRLRLISVKRENEPKKHAVVGAIRAPLNYLPEVSSLSGRKLPEWLRENAGRFTDSHLRLLRKRPLSYLAVLGSALAMCWRYRNAPFEPRKVFIKEFMQAGCIADQILDAGTVRHLHGHFCHGVATITWFASRLAGIPFSFTAHAKDIYQADLNPGDLLARKLRAATFVATCTGANHQHLSERYPQCTHIHTIYHGLDTNFFSPGARRAAGNQAPLVLSVGRLVEKKGFGYLVEACARLRQAGVAFRCLIIGEKGGDFTRIASLIREHGLSGQMSIRGAVTQDELREIYREAAVFVLPCQVTDAGDRDGIPNVLAEAMAMAIPVVSTPISGIPELVENGVNGVLVPSRDSGALASAIEEILANPEEGARLGEAARRTICERFDSRRTTVALRDLFLRAVS
jgi:glycosyltransferase involved in cell wall biosynthesis